MVIIHKDNEIESECRHPTQEITHARNLYCSKINSGRFHFLLSHQFRNYGRRESDRKKNVKIHFTCFDLFICLFVGFFSVTDANVIQHNAK